MPPSHTLLIADDDAAIRTALEALFEAEAYRLVFAENGAEALTLAAEVFPDVVLLDVMMPGLDGLEACRRLRADPRLGAVPIVLMTALEDRATRLAGLEAGADDFLTKPLDQIELQARVRAILRFNHYRHLYEEHARLETERQQTENALRQSEVRLRGLFEQLPIGVTLLDQNRNVLYANPALYKILDLSAEELIQGRRQIRRYIRPDGTPMPPEEFASERAFREQSLVRDVEIGVMTEKGAPIWTSVSAAPFQAADQGVVIITVDITDRKRAADELEQSRQQLRALTTHLQAAIEAERAHIAREIHDEFGQSMTALKMDVTWLINRLPAGDEKVERLRGMNMLIDESIALMRRIATELRPTLLDDLGLNAALEWQAHEFSRRSGLPCQLNLPKHDLGLDPALSTTLYRIFQETLTNVTRYAQATHVNVTLQQNDQTLLLTIGDNGIGITAEALNDPGALGLLGLRERAAQWGGETAIHGVAGKGTTVTVTIPLPVSPANGGGR